MKKLRALSIRILAALLAVVLFCGAAPVASIVEAGSNPSEAEMTEQISAPVGDNSAENEPEQEAISDLSQDAPAGETGDPGLAPDDERSDEPVENAATEDDSSERIGDAAAADFLFLDLGADVEAQAGEASVQSGDGAIYEVPFDGSLLRVGFMKENGKTTHAGKYHQVNNVSVSSGLTVLEAYWLDNARGNDYLVPELAILPELAAGQRLAFYGLSESDGEYSLYDYPVLDYLIAGDNVMLPVSWYSGFALVLISDYVEDEIVAEAPNGAEASVEGLLPVDGSVEIAEVAFGTDDGAETVLAFDISITDRNGEDWQPLAGSPVTVTLRDERIAAALAEGKQLRVIHIRNDKDRALESVPVLSAVGDTLTFEASGFSVYAIQVILEKTLVASDGNTYRITVTYNTDCGLPEDAELLVSEVTGSEEEMAEYISETADALFLSPGDLGYTKLFDISIVDQNGQEHQPNGDVDVTVELMDAEAEDTEDLRVVHFGSQKNKELESTVEGTTLSFTTDGFSIFSFADVSLLQRIIQAVLGKSDNVLYENDDIVLSGRMPLLGQVVAEPVTVEIDGKPALVAYDIKIYSNPVAKLLGITWQPTAGAVTVQVKSDAFTGAGNELYVYHLENENAAPELVTAAALTDGWVAFDAESFSVYAFTHVIEKVITAEDGSSYRITVSYEDDAQLPADADLLVTELFDGETYAAYMDRTAFAVGAASFDYARLFDITIVDGEGNELQPAAPVDVKIELLDLDGASEPFAVFHFADEADEGSPVPSVTSGNAVSFMASGFSAYAVVPGPTPPDPQNVQSLEELSENYNDPETGGKGFFISYFANGVTSYTTDSLNGNSAFIETDTVYGATRWYFEPAGEENTYYIYTMSSGSPLYMRNTSGNNMGLTDYLSQAAKFELSPGTVSGKFYFKLSDANRWFQHSNSGKGMRLYTDNNNPANSQLILTYAETAVIQNVYYDGKTYGLMFWNGGAAGKAMMAESSVAGALDAKALIVMSHAGNNSDKLFVPNDSEITMWHFGYVESDEYYLKAEVNGSWKYLEVTPSGMALVDTPDDDCKLHLTVGTGEHGGQICLSSERDATVTYSGNVDTGFVVGNTVGSEWLYLVELSELTSDYLRTYSAEKVSVSDPSVGNGSRVIVYARTWNETKKKYEFYAIDHDGSLQPVYESGNNVEWVGSSLNTMLWNLVEYYWEGTNDPNGYYELYNQYSERYIAPQITDGQILSPDVIGINMPGRADGYYYSKIIAWDDENFAYVGLKAERVGNQMRIVSCPMEEADDFYFAIVQDIQVDDELTTVPTVDHEQYGITMKLVNMDSREDMRNFLGSDVGGAVTTTVPGLLSTNLVDGYPTVSKGSHRGESLGNLYALGQVRTVNHLFIQSTYSGTGYYEFDSAQNYASLDRETNTFTVYKEIGTHDASSRPTLGHGQFFPFNNIEAGVFAAVNRQNLYDVHGHLLPDSDPRKYEQLYLIKNPDYYFIAELEAAFTQTPNGHDAWGHDIIYEFTGDDDFWLYVDGELVIDLGGIHSALPGSVNFATGDVTVNGKHMLLKNVFYNNYKNRGHTDAQAQAYVNGLFHQNDDGNWVFKDNTSHTMKIFYMERGAGASNLHMRFNLASVKPGTVELSKTLSQQNSDDDLNSSVYAEYLYQVYYRQRAHNYVTLTPTGTHSGPVTWSSANEDVAVVDPDTGLVTAIGKGAATIIASYDDTSEEFLVDVRMVEGECYLAVYQDGEILTQYVDSTEHLLGAESDELHSVKFKDSTTDVPYSAHFTIPRTSLSYDHVFKLRPAQTAVITLPEIAADYRIVECGVNQNVYSAVRVSEETLVVTPTADPNRFDYSTSFNSSDIRPTVLYDNEVRELRNLTIKKRLHDVLGNEIFESAEFSFRLYLATEYDEDINSFPANMEIYYVKDPDGNYCSWDTATQQFVSLGVSDFNSLTAAQKKAATFHTSMNGSISKIRGGYSVEVRGLLPGTQYRVEERSWEVPDGYSFKNYVFDSTAVEVVRASDGVKGVEDFIIANRDSAVEVHNFKGFGLRVNKKWTDASFMLSRASVYFAVFTDDGNGNLTLIPLQDSVKEMPYGGAQTLYWYYDILPVSEVTDFDNYVIREVQLTNPVTNTDGVVTSYNSMTVLDDGDPLTLSGLQKGDEAEDTFEYTVLCDTVVTSQDSNVRLFPVTNDRPSIRIFKTDWNGNPLPNAVFRLADSNDVEIGTFTSGADGLVTLVFLGSNKTYTLTETASPQGYSAMSAPITIMIAGEDVTISGPDSEEYTLDVTATPKSLTIKNRAITLQTVKMGEDDLGAPIPLAGVEFALYKQKTVGNVTGFDVEPEHGYETLLTNADGIIPGVDQTLPPGTYKLHEKAAPNGYKKIGDIIFTITATGVITLDNAQTGVMLTDVLSQSGDTRAYTLTVRNERIPPAPTDVRMRVAPFICIGLIGLLCAALTLPALRRRRRKGGEGHE